MQEDLANWSKKIEDIETAHTVRMAQGREDYAIALAAAGYSFLAERGLLPQTAADTSSLTVTLGGYDGTPEELRIGAQQAHAEAEKAEKSARKQSTRVNWVGASLSTLPYFLSQAAVYSGLLPAIGDLSQGDVAFLTPWVGIAFTGVALLGMDTTPKDAREKRAAFKQTAKEKWREQSRLENQAEEFPLAANVMCAFVRNDPAILLQGRLLGTPLQDALSSQKITAIDLDEIDDKEHDLVAMAREMLTRMANPVASSSGNGLQPA